MPVHDSGMMASLIRQIPGTCCLYVSLLQLKTVLDYPNTGCSACEQEDKDFFLLEFRVRYICMSTWFHHLRESSLKGRMFSRHELVGRFLTTGLQNKAHPCK